MAEKTAPESYLHAGLDEDNDKGGGGGGGGLLGGQDSAWAHWQHQVMDTPEQGAMGTGVWR